MGNRETKIGGVSVPKDQIANYQMQINARTGEKKHVILFKNGVRVAFSSGNGVLSSDSFKYGDNSLNNTNAYGVMGLELKGTNKQDLVNVDDCTITEIDVSGGNNDTVNVSNSKPQLTGGKAFSKYQLGLVIADYKDNVNLTNSPNIHSER